MTFAAPDADDELRIEVDGELITVPYRENDDGTWDVIAPGKRHFEQFANESARARDVRQLIRKEWSDLYRP